MSTWHKKHKEKLSRGERAADAMRNIMGSWGFVGLFCLAMAGWATYNSFILHNTGFDPYPYILLNLLLSTLAGLQGAILLIAAKRQDQIAGELAQNDYEVNKSAKEDIEKLMRKIERLEVEKLDKILEKLK